MKCKIYGGTCGVGGFCEDCPHKDHSENVLDMVEEKPLDRGKVLAILNKEMFPADKIEVLKESINSGRLDVEEG